VKGRNLAENGALAPANIHGTILEPRFRFRPAHRLKPRNIGRLPPRAVDRTAKREDPSSQPFFMLEEME
jgi:hypothetical protein